MPTEQFTLAAERQDLLKESEAILKKAQDEKNRPLTAEEQKRDDEIYERIAAIDDQLKRVKRQQEANKGQKELVDWMGSPEPPNKPEPHVEVKNRAEDDPKKGFKTPREYVLSVMDASLGNGLDERLKALHIPREKIMATAGTDEHRSDVGPYGGFGVPEAFAPGYLKVDAEPSPMRTRVVSMTAPSIKIRSRVDKDHSTSISGGLVVSRRAQTAQATATRAEQELIELVAHSLIGLAYETEELLQDSPQTFADLIQAGFQDEFQSVAIDERLNGDGVGKYLGVMNSPCLVSVSAETGQSAATIVYENVYKMRARCWRYGDAIWLANHDCLPQLISLVHVIGTAGVPVWQPSAREGEPDMLLGRPIIFTEYCQTLGTTGDIVLGNWMEYLEGIYQPLRSAESIHLRFDRNERTFRFTMRTAGAPWWRSALTPKYSSDTLSPFVALATRS